MGVIGIRTLVKEFAHLSKNVPVWVRFETHSPTGVFEEIPEALANVPKFNAPSGHVPLHGHDFFEIAFVLDGEAAHVTEQGTQKFRRGSVAIVPRGAVHGYDTDTQVVLVNLFYIGEWLATDLPELWRDPVMLHLFLAGALFDTPRHFQTLVLTLDEGTLRHALWEINDVGAQIQARLPNVLYIRACLMKLLSLVAETYHQQWTEDRGLSFRREVWFVLEEVERCIETGDGVDVKGLARACGLSPEHLSRLFRDGVGLTVMQYFQKRRAQKACRLLARRDSTVTDVAHALGFADYAHFRRQFTRYMGMTPGAFLRGPVGPDTDIIPM
jgi:AraC-like DNA-binding protein/mannose-6-phosphate isomerase-like protein (cupin superfamily)